MKTKKLLFLLIAITGISINAANAQFAFKGQWDLSASAGWIPSKGFNVTVGGEKALGDLYSAIHVKFNFMQNQAKVDLPSMDHFNYQTYLILADYNYSLAKFIPFPWAIQFHGGINLGYENIPESKVPTIVIENKSKFVYGLNVGMQVEFTAAKNFSIYLEPQFLYNFNSSIRKGFYSTALGVKYYL